MYFIIALIYDLKKEENYIKRTREALGFFLTLINKKTNKTSTIKLIVKFIHK